jgi:hypothetical protein
MSTKSINTRIYGVATDESTITGDGTTENPLTAAALGGLLYQTTLVDVPIPAGSTLIQITVPARPLGQLLHITASSGLVWSNAAVDEGVAMKFNIIVDASVVAEGGFGLVPASGSAFAAGAMPLAAAVIVPTTGSAMVVQMEWVNSTGGAAVYTARAGSTLTVTAVTAPT